MKYHIEKNTVQETLIIPLFGRLVCSERFPELFSDPEARRICDSLDYDFAEKFGCELDSVYGGVCERLISEGLLVREGDRYELTSRGIDVSNSVLAEFLLC